VLCIDYRSVDLCFDSVGERDEWKDMLELLARKEHGELVGIEPLPTPADGDAFEWLLIYSAIGECSCSNLCWSVVMCCGLQERDIFRFLCARVF
jgi:hypothetical protein